MNQQQRQHGRFVIGLVAGLLVGLGLALGVAMYITKAPIPFIDKVPQRTAEHDRVETERNRQWNPNAPLGSKAPPAGATADAGATPTVPTTPLGAEGVSPPLGLPTVSPSTRDPAAILAGGAAGSPAGLPGATPSATNSTMGVPSASTAPPLEAFVYFVQAGAFTRNDDAEQQRGKLALMGLTAKITEREQAGRTVYRVRVGPYPARDAADALLQRLQAQAVDAQIVRVERP
jgi:cell division protein FtsN